jgi:hypothetical protein
MTGVIHGEGNGNRLVIPLKVRANLPRAKDIVVFFVVDSGAPLTSLTEKTAKKLFGDSLTVFFPKGFNKIFIQG